MDDLAGRNQDARRDRRDGRPRHRDAVHGTAGAWLPGPAPAPDPRPASPGYVLNPAVVPIHDPALITTLPERTEWYHREGCGHLSVEAFWQMSKVIEVRYDRFLALGEDRALPLADL